MASSSEWFLRYFIGYSWIWCHRIQSLLSIYKPRGYLFHDDGPRKTRLTKSMILIPTNHGTILLLPCGKLGKLNLVKAMVFPVVMYGGESWTIKKAEHWRTDAFEPWCWRRLLRAPWTARRSNQSTLKEISPEYSLEGLMLKLQYFGHLMRRTDSLEKALMLGKIESKG